MSQIVTTVVGRFNKVAAGWLWECPKCKSWGSLSSAQFDGIVSVICVGPRGQGGCDYHETHNYGQQLLLTLQTRALFGDAPFDAQEAV